MQKTFHEVFERRGLRTCPILWPVSDEDGVTKKHLFIYLYHTSYTIVPFFCDIYLLCLNWTRRLEKINFSKYLLISNIYIYKSTK